MPSWLRIFSRFRRGAGGKRALALHGQGAAENQAGRHGEAARLLLAAIDADPGIAEIHYELGRAMQALGEPARAVTCFREAIDIDPRHRDAHVDLASAMRALGNPEAAEQAARGALALSSASTPASAPAHASLGAALEGQGKFAEAADSYRAALAFDPDSVPALANLSTVCLQLGAMDEAARCAERAVRVAPLNAQVHVRRGNVLMEQRSPEQAADSFREAMRLQPGDAAICNSLAFSYDMQGRLEAALNFYERALDLDPDNVQAHVNRAAIRLTEGDYARGWEEYEWRQRSAGHAPLYERFGQPRWDGSPLAGRRILVHAEQGLGDEVMFASCLPEVVAQAAHCIIDCEPRLANLYRRSFPQATVHGGKQTDGADWIADAGPIDVGIPCGSLPQYLRRTAADFPRHAGYLRAAPQRVAAWRERLERLGPGRKIGLAWRGGVPQTGRGSRSVTLEELLPVLRLEGLTFVSLQYGPTSADLAALRDRHGIEIHHFQEAFDDYDDMAALMTALDLTLSVCSAVVDLGGALGRPVWVIAPVRADFRYGLKSDAMPWYPSVRLFRQQRYGEWAPVMEVVAAALSGTAESHRELSDQLCRRGAAEEALHHGQEALRLRPGWAYAHNSIGVALQALSRFDEAIEQFERALQLDPGHASAHVNLGNALLDKGDPDAAIAHYNQAVALDPGNATAHLTLAMALEDDGRYAEALDAYGRVQALEPSDGVRIKMATMLPLYPDSAAEIDHLRAQLDRSLTELMAQPLRLRDPAREVGQTAFLLPYQGRNDRDLQVKLAALYEHACPELLYVAPHCRVPQGPQQRRRVGFASKYFNAHSVGIWFNQLISLLAKEPDFELVLIDLSGSADAELRAACARYLAPPRDLAEARQAIAREELDILVYADIGMDPLGYFLAFSRLAPVQCAMLGHPVTTGIRNVDYFISSALFEREDAQAHYSEKLVKLASLPLYIPRPLPPAAAKTRAQLRLPEGRTLYACPMMLHKFHPDFDAAMAGILRRDPRAEILLFRDSRFPRRHEALRKRFAASHGDVADRLRFLPWANLEDLMSIIQLSDVVIDTFHFSAGTTAFLVLAFGTPLITLPGDYVRGRPTYGCYLKMGMMDCVARDPAHYVDLAVRAGTDAAFREALRKRILETCGTLYADPAAATELAAFLRRASPPGSS